MADLFPIFQKADKETFAKLTALLQTVTKGNLIKHSLQRGASVGALLINTATSFIGDMQIDRPKGFFSKACNITTNLIGKLQLSEPEVVELPERVDESYDDLIERDRAELDKIFRAELRKRVEHSPSKDAALSRAIINEAYSGDGYLTTWHKADAVVKEYYADLPDPKRAYEELLSSDITNYISVNRKVLAFCIYVARCLIRRPFAPTKKELDAWTKTNAAILRASDEFNAYYSKMLPKETEFIPDAELNRRIELLEKKDEQLRNSVRKTLKDEYERKKIFSEHAVFEHDELLEQMPSFSFEWQYRNFVAKNNYLFQEKMRNGTLCIDNHRADELLKTKEVLPRLCDAINSAKEEIDIMVPWMYWDNIRHNFLSEFRAAVNRHVTIKIHYGYQKAGYSDTNKDSDFAAEELKRALGTKYLKIYREKSHGHHGKIFICDEEFYIDGSFNFLSYRGDTNDEHTTVHYDKNILRQLRQELFNF